MSGGADMNGTGMNGATGMSDSAGIGGNTGMAGAPCAFVNARLFDVAQGLHDVPGGVLVEGGRIAAIGADITAEAMRARGLAEDAVVDCGGRWLLPGLIDMCVFTGEPGYEYRETLATAAEAAAAGGVTTMIVMPDTDPVIDDAAMVDFILRRARATAKVRVAPAAAITRALAGEQMSEIGLLKEAGAVALSNGRGAVTSSRVLARALAYAHNFDMLVMHAVQDAELAGGVMHAGELSARLGLPGIPR